MRIVKQTISRILKSLITLGLFILFVLITGRASAAPVYRSTNYGVDEVFMGAGGLNDASSASYRARASLGDLAVGNASSGNFQLYGGFTTTADPYLEFYVPVVNIDLGLLSTDNPIVTTATFRVRTYLANGYVVISNSDPPRNGSYTMHNLTSATASNPGNEQFGINLAANNITGIGSFGSNPVQIPSSSFSYGYASSGYDTANLFRFVKGDVIAQSNSSSGETDYTISYLYNISSITPGGQYTFVHVLVATSYF